LFNMIKSLSKSKIAIYQINYDFIKNSIAFMNNINSVFGKSFLITPKVLDSLFTNRSASSQKAISRLDYKATPLNIGLEQTINHLSK